MTLEKGQTNFKNKINKKRRDESNGPSLRCMQMTGTDLLFLLASLFFFPFLLVFVVVRYSSPSLAQKSSSSSSSSSPIQWPPPLNWSRRLLTSTDSRTVARSPAQLPTSPPNSSPYIYVQYIKGNTFPPLFLSNLFNKKSIKNWVPPLSERSNALCVSEWFPVREKQTDRRYDVSDPNRHQQSHDSSALFLFLRL